MDKLVNEVKKYRRSLFIFNHGLGDIINFLPVWDEFCRQVDVKVNLGCAEKRQFHLLSNKILNINESYNRSFDFIYKVAYPDSKDPSIPIEHHDDPPKPYLCAYYELGMSKFMWTPWRRTNPWFNKDSKRVGVHLFGHTGMMYKFCPTNVSFQIWNEIVEAGYEPFECHMKPDWAKEYKFSDRGQDEFKLVNKNNSLRFEEPNLNRLMEEIGKCKFFIGVDSGPIYLASALLGTDKLIGLTNQKLHSHFLPVHINMVSVNNYKSGTIINKLKQMEK